MEQQQHQQLQQQQKNIRHQNGEKEKETTARKGCYGLFIEAIYSSKAGGGGSERENASCAH
jgi:hypothetical protein